MLSKSYLRRQTLLPNSLFLARSWKVLSTQHRPSQTQTGPLMSPKSSGRQPGGSFGYFKYLMTLCVVKHYLEFGKSGFCSSLCIRDRLRRTRFVLSVLCPQLGGVASSAHAPPPAPLPAPRGRPRGARTRPGAERRLPGGAGREQAAFNRGAGRTNALPGTASTRRGKRGREVPCLGLGLDLLLVSCAGRASGC